MACDLWPLILSDSRLRQRNISDFDQCCLALTSNMDDKGIAILYMCYGKWLLITIGDIWRSIFFFKPYLLIQHWLNSNMTIRSVLLLLLFLLNFIRPYREKSYVVWQLIFSFSSLHALMIHFFEYNSYLQELGCCCYCYFL